MAYTSNNASIGEITEIKGAAKIIRTDGTEETITLGTEVFEGDIIETTDSGAVNITFTDESTFAVSNDARIAIDEYVFNPDSESGTQDFSVTRGVFMYTSGLIGRENPDSVEIDTPVGSIGIRGTIIGGNINPAGESQISVIEGAIVVRNEGGEQLLSNQFETVKLSSIDVAPSEVQTLDVNTMANDYGAIKDVSVSLFSSFQDQMQQEGVSEGLDSNEDKEIVAEEGEADANAEAIDDQTNIDEPTMQEDGLMTLEEQAKMALLDSPMDESMSDAESTITGSRLKSLLTNEEANDSFLKDSSTGSLTQDFIEFDPVAQIRFAKEDFFSLPDNVHGVVPIDIEGAVISRLIISDPVPDTYSVSDFTISGTFARFYEIAQDDNDNFVFKLKDSVSVQDAGMGLHQFVNSTTSETSTSFDSTWAFEGISVTIRDGAGQNTSSIKLDYEIVDVVSDGTTASSPHIVNAGDETVFGTDGNDFIKVEHDAFKLIKGGEGLDTIQLASKTGAGIYDMAAAGVSNIHTSSSKDLSSIERITFIDGDDTLKIDIENILRLINTSDARLGGNKNFTISTDAAGTNVNDLTFVDHNGNDKTLVDFGFQHVNDHTNADGETFDVFYKEGVGTVSIESTIIGADTGGL